MSQLIYNSMIDAGGLEKQDETWFKEMLQSMPHNMLAKDS